MSTKKSAWQECLLKDLITVKKGKKPKDLYSEYQSGLMPYIDIKCFEKNIIDNYGYSDKMVIYDSNENHILLVWDGARSGLVGEFEGVGIVCSTTALIITSINKNFLKYYLNSKYTFLNKNTKGTGIPHINPDKLLNLKILVPPLEEQKLIVEKIESEFQKIDNALNKLNIIKEQIKQYKQSVLKYAFDENNSFAKGRNYEPYEWEERALKEVGTIIGGGTPDTTNENYWNGDILWVTPTDITKLNSIYLSTTNRKITKLGLENSSAKIIKKYSLIICTRATIGNSCINTNDVTTNQGIKSIIPNKDYNVLFLHYLINNNTDKLIANSSGSTFKEIAKSKLENLVFKFPNIELQKTIADNIQNIFDKIDNIENNINENIDKLNVLKQAVLKKAFEGKLI